MEPSLIDGALPRRVLLVEDHELLAQCLEFTLRGEDVQVDRAPLSSPDDLITAARDGDYDLVLLDLDLGGVEVDGGLQLVAPLQATGARVVMLTAVTDPTRLAAGVENGAVGLILKSHGFAQILAGLSEAMTLGSLLTADQRDRLLDELRRQR